MPMPHAVQGSGELGTRYVVNNAVYRTVLLSLVCSATRDTSTDNGTSTTCVLNSTTVAPITTRPMLDRWKTATARVDLPVSEVLQQPNAK